MEMFAYLWYIRVEGILQLKQKNKKQKLWQRTKSV
jgi:hypothetical protein